MHAGGIADKVGNRYEAKWLIYKLFSLLSGEALSITVEKLGDDAEGFEFVVEQASRSEWHQCKRQTANVSWTIRSLEIQGVLANFSKRLADGDTTQCVFVSTDTASAIKALREKQPQFDEVSPYVASLSKSETGDWEALVSKIGTAEETFEWLKRCEFRAQDETGLNEIVTDRSLQWVKADPEHVRGVLRTWVEEDGNMNRPLKRQDLLDALAKLGLQVSAYHLDQSVPGKIDTANDEYSSTYPSTGNSHFSISRAETEQIYSELTSGPSRIIVLAGGPGSGKSAVVKSLAARLADAGVPYLAFRADQLGEPASVDAIGTRTLDIDDSPAVILQHMAGKAMAVLFIDQADALSEMSGRSPAARASLVRLIHQAANYEHLKVVFSCRPFDLDNDHLYRKLLDRDDTIRVDLAPLDWERDVFPILSQHEVLVDQNNEKLKQVLIVPIGLTLAVDLSKLGISDLRHYNHLSQLYDSLLKAHDTELQKNAQLQWTIYSPLEAIATSMSEKQELSAPLRVLDRYPKAESLLQRQGLIIVNGSKISLRHESFFDYLHARAFIGDGKSLMDLLRSEEQTLFRRTQVRQILSHLREEAPSTYENELRALLLSDEVRQHIKEFVLSWLATATAPLAQEWDIVAAYATRFSRYTIRGAGTVIYNSVPWYRLLSRLGVTFDLLKDGNTEVRQWALSFLRSVAGGAPEDVTREIKLAMDSGRLTVAEFLNRFFWLSIDRPAPALADLMITALAQWDGAPLNQGGNGAFEIAATWAEKAPEDAARIFGAAMSAWQRLNDTISIFDALDRVNSSHFLEQVSLGAPKALLEATIPFIQDELRAKLPSKYPATTDRWRYRADFGDASYKEFIDHIRTAFGELARHDPSACRTLLLRLEPEKYVTALHMLLYAVLQNPASLSDLIVRETDNPALFDIGSSTSPAGLTMQAITACQPYLSPQAWLSIEERILRLRPELETASDHYRHSKQNPGDGYYAAESLRAWARDCLRMSGYKKWSLLQGLDPASLSPTALLALRTLDRKFAGKQSAEVTPFIPPPPRKPRVLTPNLARLSDRQVLNVIHGQALSDSRRPRTRFGGGDTITQMLVGFVKLNPTRILTLLSHTDTPLTEQASEALIRGLGDTELAPQHIGALIGLVNKGHMQTTHALIWLVHSRRAAWSDTVPAFLADLARSAPNHTNLDSVSEPASETALDRALKHGSQIAGQFANSIRALSLNALALSSVKSAANYALIEAFVDEILDEPNPPYVHAALWPFLRAGLAVNTVKVTDRINRLLDQAPHALLTDEARHTVFHLETQNPTVGCAIIARMTASTDPDVHSVGALLTLDKGFHAPDWREKAALLLKKGVQYRVILATLAMSYVNIEGFRQAATDILTAAFDDPEEIVRKEAGKCFNRIDGKNFLKHEPLYRAYVASPHLNIEQRFLPALVSTTMVYESRLLDLLDVIVERADDDATSHSLYSLWDQIQRIYSSNKTNPAIISRCLNIIDGLYKLGTSGDSKLAAISQ